MTSKERLVKIQELRAEKEAIGREIKQTRRHVLWHTNKMLRLASKLTDLDAEQVVLIYAELHARGEEERA